MPVLYDRQNQPHEIPEEQVAEALASGQFSFPKGQDVIMRGKTGDLYDVPPEEALEMYQRGYRIETGEEARIRERGEKYGGAGGQLATAAHAIGNTLTFGGLDYLGSQALGKEYTKPVREMKEENPNLHLTAELATIAGSFIANPASAVGKLTKLPRAVGKIGTKIEKAILPTLAGPKAGLVRKALAKGTALGTGAGVEGAIWNAGNFMSEASLGETEATAENLLGYVGMGAMWGGVAGGALGAGGEIIKRGIGSGANFAKRSGKSIRKMYEKARGVKAIDGLDGEIEKAIKHGNSPDLLDKIGARWTGADATKIAKLKDPKVMQQALDADKIVNSMADEMADRLDRMRVLAAEVHEQGRGQLKYRHTKDLLKETSPLEVQKTNLGLLKTANDDLDGMIVAGPERYGDAGAIEEIKALVLKADEEITQIAKLNPKKVVQTNLEEIEHLKQSMQKRIKRLERRIDKPYASQQTIKKLNEIEVKFRRSLEDPLMYGPRAAGYQQARNAAYVQKLHKPQMTRHFEEEYVREAYKPVYVTNRKSLKTALRDSGMSENKYKEEFLREYADKEIALAKITDDAFDLGPAYKDKISEMEHIRNRIEGLMDDAQHTIGLKNQLADIVTASNQLRSLMSPIAGAGVGYALGGPEGAVIGLGFSMATNPARKLHTLAGLNRISSKSEVGIAKAIKGYIKKATGKVKKVGAKVKPVPRGMLAPASLKILQGSNWGEKKTKDETRQKAFTKRSKELTEFLSNPQKTVERITKNTSDIAEVAPNIATAMQIKAVQTARYAYDRMPKPLSGGTLFTEKFKPSDLELAKWERIVAVLDNPENALKSLRAGMLTVEEVDALAANYPKMYERIVMTIAEQAPELQDKLPLKEQNQLKILFGVAIHPTHDPGFVQTMAMLDAVPPVAPGQPPGPKQPQSKIGDYDKLSVDTATMTDTQKVEVNKLS
jgi:hypothetical protein